MRNKDKILILDFGSQYTQLIARRVREIGVFSEVKPSSISTDKIIEMNPSGIILSGGPETVTVSSSQKVDKFLLKANIPILGICYGMQTIANELEWVRQNPKARQSKSQARINAYEALVAESQAREKGPSPQQIVIPSGERLGSNVIELKNISKGFGDKLLIDDLSLKIPPGAIVGIIGPNGAGKTTLFNMLSKKDTSDSGAILIGESVNLGYIDQNRDSLIDKNTVWSEISGGSEQVDLGKQSVPSRAYVSWFNFKGGDQQKIIGQLSGGERNRVHLAKMLKSGANVLLLDEPTNDLDVDTLRALEEALTSFAGCALITSHDRYFLDRIATHILAFEGSSHVEWFQGNYEAYEEDRKRRLGDLSDRPHRIKYKPISR